MSQFIPHKLMMKLDQDSKISMILPTLPILVDLTRMSLPLVKKLSRLNWEKYDYANAKRILSSMYCLIWMDDILVQIYELDDEYTFVVSVSFSFYVPFWKTEMIINIFLFYLHKWKLCFYNSRRRKKEFFFDTRWKGKNFQLIQK